MQTNPRYFKLEEFLSSSTARQKSIENLPSWDVCEHLRELAFFLDGVRAAWGSGINVTSGFRNDKLNSVVGGVRDSVHRIGFAADLQPANGKFEEFKKFMVNYLKDKDFDELIIERNKRTQWLHIQLFSNNGYQRHKVFSMSV